MLKEWEEPNQIYAAYHAKHTIPCHTHNVENDHRNKTYLSNIDPVLHGRFEARSSDARQWNNMQFLVIVIPDIQYRVCSDYTINQT